MITDERFGDLIQLGMNHQFDVITHGCNCFCNMNAGLAAGMKRYFLCDTYPLESPTQKGNINKLGQIDYREWRGSVSENKTLIVINSYTQYQYGRAEEGRTFLDYDALTLCMKKINHLFRGKNIGVPQIGCGLARGDWERVREIIKVNTYNCAVTIVHFNPEFFHEKIRR